MQLVCGYYHATLNFLTFAHTQFPSGLDYLVQSQQDFTIGENTHHVSNDVCFDIFIVDDNVAEGNERATFQLQLNTDVDWVVIQIPNKMEPKIVIHDNDGNTSSFIAISFPILTL